MQISNLPNLADSKSFIEQITSNTPQKYPRFINKPIVLYGAGDMGKMAFSYFNNLKIKIEFIVDQKAKFYELDNFWDEIDLIHPDQLRYLNKDNFLFVICLAASPFSEIEHFLMGLGCLDISSFYDIAEAYKDIFPLSNGWFANNISNRDLKEMSDTLEFWDDDISRAHYIQFYAWRRLREDWQFRGAEINNQNRYFIPEIKAALRNDESFLDIGAHHGQIIEKFISETKGSFAKIWAIEPDQLNFSQLCKKVLAFGGIEKITVMQEALSSLSKNTSFYSGLGYYSQFFESGDTNLITTTIDELNLNPTFIKIHLEGYELDCLKGGLKTIKKHRPILVATVYHNRLGLWETFKWLHDNLIDYSFRLRLHSWLGTGLVLYAIPKERTNNE